MREDILAWRYTVSSRRTFVLVAFAVLVVSPLGGAILAHHSRAAYSGEEITLEGVVTQYVWRNPHIYLIFDVKGDSGEVVRWSGELSAVTSMIAAGLARDSFKPGDAIRVNVQPAHTGEPFGLLGSIWRQDGTKMLDGDYRSETR